MIRLIFLLALIGGAVFWLIFYLRRPKIAPLAHASIKMTHKDACDILGVSATPTQAEIEQAYRSLMHKYHPDHGGEAWVAARINAARDYLLKTSL